MLHCSITYIPTAVSLCSSRHQIPSLEVHSTLVHNIRLAGGQRINHRLTTLPTDIIKSAALCMGTVPKDHAPSHPCTESVGSAWHLTRVMHEVLKGSRPYIPIPSLGLGSSEKASKQALTTTLLLLHYQRIVLETRQAWYWSPGPDGY